LWNQAAANAKIDCRQSKKQRHMPLWSPALSQGVFTSHANPKYFLFHPSHRIFRRMHGGMEH
jgi:threonine/homoserine/homoserine lactone efflux protein